MKNNITLSRQVNNQEIKSGRNIILTLVLISLMLVIETISFAQDIKVVKSGPSVANPGEIITYIIAFKSDGNSSGNIVITDYLPSKENTTYISSYPSGIYNKEANTITWDKSNFAELINLGSEELYIKVTVQAGVLNKGVYSVSDNISKLSSFTAIKGEKTSMTFKSNIVNTDVPRLGGAVLPVE